jgi:hypothetical protein
MSLTDLLAAVSGTRSPHNINGGPLNGDGTQDATAAYQELGLSYVRTHDFYGPFDMSTIWNGADPSDCANFTFADTDDRFQAILDAGLGVYFRMGESFVPDPRTLSPIVAITDVQNWATAAVQVLRHYGAENWCPTTGYVFTSSDIDYVEIWNEPNFDKFWDDSACEGDADFSEDNGTGDCEGTGFPDLETDRTEEFVYFFETVFRAIKTEFPTMKVGGPGFFNPLVSSPNDKPYVRDFLRHMRKDEIALDFVSWHIYTNDPNDVVDDARFISNQLTDTLAGTESHLTEWNLDSDYAHLVDTGVGAAIASAVMVGILTADDISMAFYYRGVGSTWGLWGSGSYRDSGTAAWLWKRFLEPEETSNGPLDIAGVSFGDDGVVAYALQTTDGDVAMLLASTGDESHDWDLTDLPGTAVTTEIYQLGRDGILYCYSSSGACDTPMAYTSTSQPTNIEPFQVQLVLLGF